MQDLVVIENMLQRLDLTEIIKYSEKLQDLGKGANTMLAPIYLRDFVMALDLTNTRLASAIQADNKAKAAVKEAEAIAFIDRAADYLEQNGIKSRAVDALNMYVQIDPDVKKARDIKAKTEAMVSLLKGKSQVFRCAHDDVKKIAYSSDNNDTAYEGM